MIITFELLKESHFPLLLKWLEAPHVKKWWDQDITYTVGLVREKFGRHTHGLAISKNSSNKTYAYVICLNKEKIGYIQAYNAHDFSEENGLDLASIAGSICGVDLFIGDPSFLNKGIGPQILNEFEKQILAWHFDWCLVDPSKDNRVAVKAFEKSGFKVAGQFQTESHIWMIKELSSTPFVYTPDPIFDDKITKALRRGYEELTVTKKDFERINVYLKQEERKVAGAICYIHGKILWCDSIYVEEAFQNKGLGSQLADKLLEIAAARDLREIQLNTYFPKALAFFKKCGFEEVAVVPNWKYDLTCYLMRKII